MGGFRDYMELVRLPNSLMMGVAVAIAVGIASSWSLAGLSVLELAAAVVAGIAVTGVVMMLNDIADLEADRVNAPWRPLPSGRVRPETALTLSALLAAVGLAAASLAGTETVVSYIVVLMLGASYNFYFKRTGVLGNLIVSGLVASPFVYAALILDSFNPSILYFALMVFLAVLGREIVKGIPDVEGDKRAGVRTLAVILGPRAAALAASILYALAALLSLAPLVAGYVKPQYYAPLIALLDVLVAYEIYVILRDSSRETILAHKNRVLFYMLIGLLAFTVGTLP